MPILDERIQEGIGGGIIPLPPLPYKPRERTEEHKEVEGMRRQGIMYVPSSLDFGGDGFLPFAMRHLSKTTVLPVLVEFPSGG
jgi:hypothetical protein